MLGARARAAEYHAFKAASARTASREAEEHKLPPKPAPVSLSAYTKTAQLNRNKGNKAWKPLILEDTPEAEDDRRDNEDTFSTPTRGKTADRSNSASEGSDMSLAPAQLKFARASNITPNSILPTAPRAMLMISQTPSALINPTPQRVQQHPILKVVQEGVAPGMDSSPSHYSGTGGYPYPCLTWWYDSRGMPVLAPASMPAFEPSQYHNSFMVPDDISPTKQENKFADMHHGYTDQRNAFPSYQHFNPLSGNVGNSWLPEIPVTQNHDHLSCTFFPQNNAFAINPIQRPPTAAQRFRWRF